MLVTTVDSKAMRAGCFLASSALFLIKATRVFSSSSWSIGSWIFSWFNCEDEAKSFSRTWSKMLIWP